MAYIGITASASGLAVAGGGDLDARLAAGVSGLAPDAPLVALVHGYRFDPGEPASDPHRSLFAFRPETRSRRIRSWPLGLGFSADGPEGGLAIGFGWPASAAPDLPSLVATGRAGFADAYERAPLYGARLAELVTRLQALAPGRPVDVFAHSLGARVALEALPHLDAAPGRVVLLGAAEFDARARERLAALRAPRPPEIYNITARANDLYDLAFETFAPRRNWTERALGLGLGDAPPFWLDLQLDRAELADWIGRRRGIALAPARERFSHWSFYTRRGAFRIYQAILRRRPGWDVATLAAESCPAAQEPRWSRLGLGRRLPRLATLRPGLPLPGIRIAPGLGLGRGRA